MGNRHMNRCSISLIIRERKKERKKVKLLSRVRLFATPWTVAYQAPLSMWFSRKEYWSGLPFPSPGDIPDPGIEPRSPPCRQMLYPLSLQEDAHQNYNEISPHAYQNHYYQKMTTNVAGNVEEREALYTAGGNVTAGGSTTVEINYAGSSKI